MLTKNDLVTQLINLGLKEGAIANVKVSLKSIGQIEGGAKTLVEAILEVIGEDGTLVCDSFNPEIYSFQRFFKKKNIVSRYSKSYAGAFVNAVVNYPGSYRSNHPLQAFSSIGKHAKELTESFTKDSTPYGFLKQIASMGAVNLRIGNKVVGVGTTHIAIIDMGFEQKNLSSGAYYRDVDGKVKFYRNHWASGCNTGFNTLFHHYEEGDAIISNGRIGEANALITNMQKTLDIERELFRKDSTAFFCDDPGCISCSFNWKHSKYTFWNCFSTNIKKRQYGKAAYALMTQLFGVWNKE